MSHETPDASTSDPEGRATGSAVSSVSTHESSAGGYRADVGDSGDGGGYDDDDLFAGRDERREPGFFANVWGGIKEIVIIAVMAIVLSFVVKTWLIQAFYIPSESMENTLLVNDRVIVSKLTPGPIDIQRGDIVVFQDPDHWLPSVPAQSTAPGARGAIHRGLQFIGLLPDDSDDHLIKRVIGLPGDHVTGPADGGKITVNGVPITETYIKDGDTPNGGRDAAFDITVPPGRVWVMGDHRGDSADSRYHDDGTGATGSVPISDITGRAVTVVWPLDHVRWLSVPSSIYAKIPNASTTTPAKTATTSAP